MDKTITELTVKNLLRIFLDSIKEYENEGNTQICRDERDSLEFVEIFLDSEDAFNYLELLETCGPK